MGQRCFCIHEKISVQKTLAKVNVFLFTIFYSIKTKYEILYIILSFKMEIFAKTYCFLENFGLPCFWYYTKIIHQGGLIMAQKKYTKAVAIVLSLSTIANFSPQVYASDSVAIPNNNRPPVLLANNSEIHSKNQFSVKSINKKLSSIIRPDKKVDLQNQQDTKDKKVNKALLETKHWNCGPGKSDSVKANLDLATGILRISGSGEMASYSTVKGNFAPWYNDPDEIKEGEEGKGKYRKNINSVIIEEGVTNIGDCAFYNLDVLGEVSIPSSVKKIGDSAFFDCYSLSFVEMSEGIESIESGAFKNTGLAYVKIPNSVTKIGSGAFRLCSKLHCLKIGSKVADIGDRAFADNQNLYSVGFLGSTEPTSSQVHAASPFSNCPKLEEIYVPKDYNSDIFCKNKIKKVEVKEIEKCRNSFKDAYLTPVIEKIENLGNLVLNNEDKVNKLINSVETFKERKEHKDIDISSLFFSVAGCVCALISAVKTCKDWCN